MRRRIFRSAWWLAWGQQVTTLLRNSRYQQTESILIIKYSKRRVVVKLWRGWLWGKVGWYTVVITTTRKLFKLKEDMCKDYLVDLVKNEYTLYWFESIPSPFMHQRSIHTKEDTRHFIGNMLMVRQKSNGYQQELKRNLVALIITGQNFPVLSCLCVICIFNLRSFSIWQEIM